MLFPYGWLGSQKMEAEVLCPQLAVTSPPGMPRPLTRASESFAVFLRDGLSTYVFHPGNTALSAT